MYLINDGTINGVFANVSTSIRARVRALEAAPSSLTNHRALWSKEKNFYQVYVLITRRFNNVGINIRLLTWNAHPGGRAV